MVNVHILLFVLHEYILLILLLGSNRTGCIYQIDGHILCIGELVNLLQQRCHIRYNRFNGFPIWLSLRSSTVILLYLFGFYRVQDSKLNGCILKTTISALFRY